MSKTQKIKSIIDQIFTPESLKYGLKEFSDYKPEEILGIKELQPQKFYLKDIKSGENRLILNQEKQISKPEEIVRQLWLYKLNKFYKYPMERIETEKSIHFGQKEYARADIVVYKKDKITPYIIIEVKKPDIKKGIDQLKSYLNSEGCEIGVWSNGSERVILYRPYPKEFEDSLNEIPAADQTIDDLFEVKKRWSDLDPHFDLTKIIKQMEELALAGSGANVFEEIFKIIYAKLYDEKMAREQRNDEEVIFRKYRDAEKTYDIINDELFKNAIDEWPDVFEPTDHIRLSPERLNVCVPLIENHRFFEIDQAELEIIDQAFEYLITQVAKGSKGQYFTPRHVIKMCVKMLNPKQSEYIVDPACGSGGFLLHAMWYVWDQYLQNKEAQKNYAAKFLFGLDFDDNMRRISQALMLIAGDGRHHIFKRNSLDARDWQGIDAEDDRHELRPLLSKLGSLSDNKENQKTFRHLNFDLLLTNPPFAGETPEPGVLRQYELAKKDGSLRNNVERHILFIERTLDMLKPNGRMAIVLPQGVLNNTNMQYIREWLFGKARILAVVGLHGNTFKPHTGTKTSVLFLQKWAEKDKSEKDYPIFMAVSKRGGKDNSGDYIYKKDEKGEILTDQKGRKIIDHDLTEIADEFIKFAKEQKLNFWR